MPLPPELPVEADSTDTTSPAELDLTDLGSFSNKLGLRVTSVSRDQLEATWTVTTELLQPYGLLHGGAHCAVVETLASVAGAVWLGREGRVVGTNNNTDFYRASTPGDQLTSTARPLHRGKSRQVWRVETVDASGRLVAAGQVQLQNLRP